MATLSRIKSKKGTEYEGNLGAMILLFVIMGGIVYYAIIISPDERDKLGIGLAKFSKDILDTTPGLIKATPLARTESGLHVMQDVTVDARARERTTRLMPSVTISKSFVDDRIANITFDLSRDLVRGAGISARVQSADGPAEIIVVLNGHEIESKPAKTGQTIETELPMSYLSEKNSLELRLRTTSSFRSATYELRDISLITLEYDDSKTSVIRSFTMTDAELSGLRSATLSAYLKSLTAEAGKLAVELNGEAVYDDFPLSNFAVKLPASNFRAGQNNLVFKVNRGTAYGLSFPQVATTFAREPASSGREYKFQISSFVISGIRAGRMNCPLVLHGPASGEVTIHINSNQVTETFEKSEIRTDVCRYFKQGDNSLSLSSAKGISVDKMTLGVREK
jgi:hypothetical protein